MNGKQGFYQEDSRIGRSLKDILSVDASCISRSNSSNEVLKVMNERFEALRTENETARKKQEEHLKTQFSPPNDETLKLIVGSLRSIHSEMAEMKVNQKKQEEVMKGLLEELRFTRMEIVEMKKKQEEDRKQMNDIKMIITRHHESLENPKILQLVGRWERDRLISCRNIYWLNGNQHFQEEGKYLTWSSSSHMDRIVAKVRVGSNECKIKENGKIEIFADRSRFELSVSNDYLTIRNGTEGIFYKRY